MPTVQFNEVGRDKQSWVQEVGKLTTGEILKHIRQHGVVLDRHHTQVLVRWSDNRNADIKRGDMTVGKIHVLRLSL